MSSTTRTHSIPAASYVVRPAHPDEYARIGQILVEVYASLDGFPKPDEHPGYYEMLANVGDLVEPPATELLVAANDAGTVDGSVLFVRDMAFYRSGGTAPQAQDACGFRLLAVHPSVRGKGIGTLLSEACLDRARATKKPYVVIHTTDAMDVAWRMYERFGFKRATEFDFVMDGLQVYGLRLTLPYSE